MTRQERKKPGNATGEGEGAFLLFFLSKHFHRYCLRPKFNRKKQRIKQSSFQKILVCALGELETINEYIYKLYT